MKIFFQFMIRNIYWNIELCVARITALFPLWLLPGTLHFHQDNVQKNNKKKQLSGTGGSSSKHAKLQYLTTSIIKIGRWGLEIG